MASVEELEELGRVIMGASVTAEYLELAGVVSFLDVAFADIIRLVVDQRRRMAEPVEVDEGEVMEETRVGC